jgi:signal transduction histidine kinase
MAPWREDEPHLSATSVDDGVSGDSPYSAEQVGVLSDLLTPQQLDVSKARAGHAEAVRLRRRQLGHDIKHELGTIMMLASVLSSSSDVGSESRKRAQQILGETRWLEQLQRAYEEASVEIGSPEWTRPLAPVRLDLLTSEIATALKLSAMTRITCDLAEVWAYADQLAYWRALRNILGNAVRAAGPHGHVHVEVSCQKEWAQVQIDDDGPGFGAGAPGIASLGLGIVQELVMGWGGHLEIRNGALGGACVRLQLLAASPSADFTRGSEAPCE